MNTEISVKQVIADAAAKFHQGYFCSEALLVTICEHFGYDPSVMNLASGMCTGMGVQSFCGAVNGGVLALGMVFGRSELTSFSDPNLTRAMDLSGELHSWFIEATSKHSVQCIDLTEDVDFLSPEQINLCAGYTGMCAGKVAELIIREKGLTNIDA